MSSQPDRVWVIDTSSILAIRREVPTAFRRRCLDGLDALVGSGHLVYPREVVLELERGCSGAELDTWCLWTKKHQKKACSNGTDFDRLEKVLALVPRLVDVEQTTGVEAADPYVIE